MKKKDVNSGKYPLNIYLDAELCQKLRRKYDTPTVEDAVRECLEESVRGIHLSAEDMMDLMGLKMNIAVRNDQKQESVLFENPRMSKSGGFPFILFTSQLILRLSFSLPFPS